MPRFGNILCPIDFEKNSIARFLLCGRKSSLPKLVE